MSVSLGVATFLIGGLPLSFTFSSELYFICIFVLFNPLTESFLCWYSESRIAYLSTVGTGLLLGAALGIIIPECVKYMVPSYCFVMLNRLLVL